MHNNEHLKLLVQAVSIVAALHFAKGSMTGEYRNLMAVGLVVVVLVVVNHLLSEYEGALAQDHLMMENKNPDYNDDPYQYGKGANKCVYEVGSCLLKTIQGGNPPTRQEPESHIRGSSSGVPKHYYKS